jgi:3-hydroxyisobutyrate dehydrogenase
MKVGFIGLGAMGRHMAASLQRAGHEVAAHDLRKVEGFPNFKNSPEQAARDCEVLFTSLPGPAEVDSVASGIGSSLKEGTVWFDLTTNSPAVVRRIHGELAKHGVHFLDAPVSGGPKGAQSGKLAIWVGGEAGVYEKFLPVLKAIGDQPLYVGPIGAGSVAKLTHNITSFSMMAMLAEVFTLGVKAGVEPVALLKALRQGATGRKRTFDRLPEHWLPGKFDPPDFTVRLALKDATLALEMARECGVPMRVGQIALGELKACVERGWSERDSRVAMTLQEERAEVSVRVAAEKLQGILD